MYERMVSFSWAAEQRKRKAAAIICIHWISKIKDMSIEHSWNSYDLRERSCLCAVKWTIKRVWYAIVMCCCLESHDKCWLVFRSISIRSVCLCVDFWAHGTSHYRESVWLFATNISTDNNKTLTLFYASLSFSLHVFFIFIVVVQSLDRWFTRQPRAFHIHIEMLCDGMRERLEFCFHREQSQSCKNKAHSTLTKKKRKRATLWRWQSDGFMLSFFLSSFAFA